MTTFYFGLSMVICGNGLLKSNISTIVGTLYRKGIDDDRRDKGFTIFYMGINMGAFLAGFIAGGIGENVSWHLGSFFHKFNY